MWPIPLVHVHLHSSRTKLTHPGMVGAVGKPSTVMHLYMLYVAMQAPLRRDLDGIVIQTV